MYFLYLQNLSYRNASIGRVDVLPSSSSSDSRRQAIANPSTSLQVSMTGTLSAHSSIIPPHVRTSLVCFNRGKNSKIARAAVGAEMACDGLFFSVA